MGTSNGAKALSIDAGMLVAGKKADVILIDLKKDMMFTPLLKEPKEERRRMLESHLVFGCNGSGVDTVIVDGRIVVEGRKVWEWMRSRYGRRWIFYFEISYIRCQT